MGDRSAAVRDANTRRALGHHVIWTVTAVGVIVSAWVTAGSTGTALFWAPFAVGVGWGAAVSQWSLAAGGVEREQRPRGKPHPRSRRAQGWEAPRSLPPPWRWPVVLAYVVPLAVAVPAAPFVRDAEDAGLVAAIVPFSVLLGWLCGICVTLFVLLFRIVVAGVVGFGRPLVTGEVEGEPVERSPLVGPFVATASVLLLPLVLVGALAYDSPYRRDVLPLLGIVRDGVHVDHPVLLGISQLATWLMILGLLGGRIAHGKVARRRVG